MESSFVIVLNSNDNEYMLLMLLLLLTGYVVWSGQNM